MKTLIEKQKKAVFHSHHPLDEFLSHGPFAIITAHNPDGKNLPKVENEARDLELGADLDAIGCRKLRIIGGSPDWKHEEAGWAAWISKETALDLGGKFSQVSIFWVDGILSLLICGPEVESHALGDFKQKFLPAPSSKAGKVRLTPSAKKSLAEIARAEKEDLYNNASEQGLWFQEEDLPTLKSYKKYGDPEWFEGLVDKKRLEELEDGSQPTPAEIEAYQEKWMDEYEDQGEDADSVWGYAIAPVKDDKGNEGVAIILCKGYSWSGISMEVEGIFASKEAAAKYLEKGGWCR